MRDEVWQIKERERELARAIAPKFDLHPVAAEVMLQRGIREETAMRRFLYPDLSHLHDPCLLPAMDRAVQRIRWAIEQRETIAIYGDYDVDGLTATALLVSYFQELGVDVIYHIPQRLEEGYGVHREVIAELAQRGVQLLITVDCGINAQEEIVFAQELGMDVIITDHHTPEASRLPGALAVINPKLAPAYPFKELAGVGVALKLVQALGGLAAAAKYLDLATLGTIADVVPLLDENRVIVRFGLEALGNSQRPGVKALLAVAGLDPSKLGAGQVAFIIAPRLNAAGRLNEAQVALELLLTGDYTLALELAEKLESFNAQRQTVEQRIFEEADAMVAQLAPDERWCLVLAKADWHPGVIGIVASRLVERYHRPAILLTIAGQEARGSGRSVPGYDLVASLTEHAHLLLSYGGHRAAAGLTLATSQIPALRAALNTHVRARLTAEQLRPCVYLDGELDPSEITLDLVHSLEKLGPYGAGNPEPVFCSKRWHVQRANPLGRECQHVKLELNGGGLPWEVLAWRRSQDLAQFNQTQWLDVAYTPQVNHWNGQERLVLHLKSWRLPPPDETIAVYDARFLLNRESYLQGLFEQEKTVLVLFWPAFSLPAWPTLQSALEELPLWQSPHPLYLRLIEGRWQAAPPQSLPEACDLVWLDVPQGLPSLERLTADLGESLYHHRIHLLYNVNDVDRIYSFWAENGPNRSALATLYRGLKTAGQRSWRWGEIARIVQKDGFLGLPDQIHFHLRVLKELALAEYACSSEGVSIDWLPEPMERQQLSNSTAFVQAQVALAAFAEARNWLRGPDAGSIVARSLRSLIPATVSR